MPSIEGLKISQLPQANTLDESDVLAGVQTGTTKKFALSTLVAWIKAHLNLTAADVGAVPTSAVGAAGGVAGLDSNGKVPGTQLDLSGKQDKITASGILKGDGQGGVTAATPGTDYQAPLTIDATPTASSTNPVQSGGVYTDVRTRVPVYGMGENLLVNAYFVGGGSQLGDGIFPINQRGQTSYSGTGYGIDRWKQSRSEIQQVVLSDCFRMNAVSAVSSGNLVYCYFYCPKLPAGTYTLSFLVKEATGSGSWYYSSDASSGYGNVGNVRLLPGLVTKTFTATGSETAQSFYLWHQGALAVGDHLDIIAGMLEGGSEQNLCHNEGTVEAPVWVLNKIPDYGEELRKCQRYLCVLNANGATYGVVGSGVAYSATRVECLSFLPLQMIPASNPSFSYTGSWQISDGISGGQALPVTSISVNLTAYYSGNSLVLAVTVSGATAGKFYVLRAANDANARIFISAEL